MYKAKILGTGSYVPSNIVKNSFYEEILDTTDEWITSRTGIKERRISTGENTLDLCYNAALSALENSNTDPLELDYIIVATVTPDYFTPSTSCLLQYKLNAKNASCFDINAACTGFIYALSIAAQFIENNNAKKILVIGGEALTKVTNFKDRSTCVLFGDGAGSVIMGRCEEGQILNIKTGSVGEEGKALKIDGIKMRNIFVENGSENDHYIEMNGKEVFKFAVSKIMESIDENLKIASLNLDDIKYIIPHQANLRMIEYVSKSAKIPMDKFYINIDKYGNTSSATIPIALDELNKNNMINPGDKLLMVGFGGGLTYGSALIEW